MDASIAARLGGIKNSLSDTLTDTSPLVLDAVGENSLPPVIQSTNPSNAKTAMRIYRSSPPGTRFQFLSGVEIYFNHGWYETDNPTEIAELDAVVASGKGCIYTDARQDKILEAVNKARAILGENEITANVAEVLNQAVVIGEQVEMQVPAIGTMPVMSPADQAGIDPIQSLQMAIRNAGAAVAGSSN